MTKFIVRASSTTDNVALMVDTKNALADLERARDFACESHRRSWPSQTEEGRSNVG